MSDKNPAGARQVAVIILLGLAAVNIGYGVFLLAQGGELALPLFIGGAMCGALAAVLSATGAKPGGK